MKNSISKQQLLEALYHLRGAHEYCLVGYYTDGSSHHVKMMSDSFKQAAEKLGFDLVERAPAIEQVECDVA